ncbi:hypothetical protein CYMTET_18074 [Cymbomonas tetramitiformis]|uniref:C3H1-type domain-containing protein n=1 Tax=Cymbomonas tetramitiformis TaxID=36881 RepID=A0AAE0L6M6_9CHLO|nr:hypothetical protein CYMTET_18074 [Cymbomonas tetramitiformis]
MVLTTCDNGLEIKPRTALIIDAGLLWNYRNKTGEKVDNKNGVRVLLEKLQRKKQYKFEHTHYVDAEPPQNEEGMRSVFETRIRTAMELGISTSKARCKMLKYWSKGTEFSRLVQADADAKIVTKIMSLVAMNQLDELCLVTGDGDFEDCLNYVRNTAHKRITLASFRLPLSPLIRQHAHECCYLEDWWEDLKYTPEGGQTYPSRDSGFGRSKSLSPVRDFPTAAQGGHAQHVGRVPAQVEPAAVHGGGSILGEAVPTVEEVKRALVHYLSLQAGTMTAADIGKFYAAQGPLRGDLFKRVLKGVGAGKLKDFCSQYASDLEYTADESAPGKARVSLRITSRATSNGDRTSQAKVHDGGGSSDAGMRNTKAEARPSSGGTIPGELLRTDNSKTALCKFFMLGPKGCLQGSRCPFAHGAEELRHRPTDAHNSPQDESPQDESSPSSAMMTPPSDAEGGPSLVPQSHLQSEPLNTRGCQQNVGKAIEGMGSSNTRVQQAPMVQTDYANYKHIQDSSFVAVKPCSELTTKTKMCQFYSSPFGCRNGARCTYAHSVHELRRPSLDCTLETKWSKSSFQLQDPLVSQISGF